MRMTMVSYVLCPSTPVASTGQLESSARLVAQPAVPFSKLVPVRSITVSARFDIQDRGSIEAVEAENDQVSPLPPSGQALRGLVQSGWVWA